LEKYAEAKKIDIKNLARESNSDFWTAMMQIVPSEGETEPFVGFFIAVGGSGSRRIPNKDGVPYLAGFRLDTLNTDKQYMEAMKVAVTHWTAFADWCDKQGIILPEPHISLIEIEVA
jgi:hypothetical protein